MSDPFPLVSTFDPAHPQRRVPVWLIDPHRVYEGWELRWLCEECGRRCEGIDRLFFTTEMPDKRNPSQYLTVIVGGRVGFSPGFRPGAVTLSTVRDYEGVAYDVIPGMRPEVAVVDDECRATGKDLRAFWVPKGWAYLFWTCNNVCHELGHLIGSGEGDWSTDHVPPGTAGYDDWNFMLDRSRNITAVEHWSWPQMLRMRSRIDHWLTCVGDPHGGN